jgi:hypothetical protein
LIYQRVNGLAEIPLFKSLIFVAQKDLKKREVNIAK